MIDLTRLVIRLPFVDSYRTFLHLHTSNYFILFQALAPDVFAPIAAYASAHSCTSAVGSVGKAFASVKDTLAPSGEQ